jgi:nicotinamide phosphoribosyltransferase
MEHIEQLWDLQYLPLRIKALPEGSLCPTGVPCMTITNIVDHAYWLVNYLETVLSAHVWGPMTSATIAHQYRKLLNSWAMKTVGNVAFVDWQAHDFSARGLFGSEAQMMSGMGHLLSFTGTDTILGIFGHEKYYNANVEKELVGSSVPSTEHSVMCMGTKDDEIGTFSRLLDLYKTAMVLSVVSDTWDLWYVLNVILPALKEKILAGTTKLVIRPDSGDPVKIITGWKPEEYFYDQRENKYYQKVECSKEENPFGFVRGKELSESEVKGVIQLLWDVFGGKTNELGYKELDPHVGAIYGDSITLERAEQICQRLADNGFASTNIVFGVGSYTYQMNTRDTFGFAVKATYGEVNHEGREIFKDPVTDDGTKKSAKGLLKVEEVNGTYKLIDQVTPEQETEGALVTVFEEGKMVKDYSLSEIRTRLAKQIS